MKTAILLATRKGDILAVKFLSHSAFSEVLAEFKDRVANDRGEPGYDSLEIWTGPPVKTAHRLSSGDQEPIAIVIEPGTAPTAEQFAEIAKAWEETHSGLVDRIAELETALAEAVTKFQDAAPQGEDKASPVEGQVSGGDAIPPGDEAASTTTELPTNTEQAGTGEGDLPGVQASTVEPELLLTPPAENPQPGGEASPGSMSPKKKAGR